MPLFYKITKKVMETGKVSEVNFKRIRAKVDFNDFSYSPMNVIYKLFV